ncbi:MAG: radical SAM protein [Clostridia bacterium]|nr:radical SAM protein [Clostridia bacterium]
MRDCETFSPDYFGQLRQWAKANTVPLNATFELTPLCNFNCVMCYVHLTKEQAQAQGRILSADEWIEIAGKTKEMGTLNLCLTGGEPLVRPDFWEIYSQLNKMGFLITVLSNGSLIDEDTMAKFAKYGMPYSMKLTMYGASDETYQRTCHSTDGFTRFSKAVDLLKEAKVPLKMTSTIVRENACDLQEIYRFARERGIPMQHTISVVKSSRGSINTVETSRFALDDFPDELSIEALEKSKFPPLDSPFAWCTSKEMSFWMTWNGHLQLCSMLSKPYVKYSGNLSEDWAKLQQELKEVKSPSECSDCQWSSFCQRCPGILCAESGDPEDIDEGLCDMAKRLFELYNMKLHQEGKNEEDICCP